MFELNDSQRAFSMRVRKFAEERVFPIAGIIDREDRFPDEIFESLANIGVLGIMTPPEYGGRGPDLISCALAMEELAKKSVSIALSFGQHAVFCSYSIYRLGSHMQRQKYLSKLASGRWLGAWALTEPGAGSDAFAIRTVATRRRTSYFLNGSKIFITNGPIAHIFLVAARTGSESESQSRMSLFIVERETIGFTLGEKMRKCGNRGSPTCELFFDDARISPENLLGGEEGNGWAQALSILNVERAIVCFKSLGNAEGALETIIQYCKENMRNGQPLYRQQWIKMKLAEMAVKVQAAKLLAHRALMDVLERVSSTTLSSMAKLFCSEAAVEVASRSMEIMGVDGYTDKFPMERILRDAKLGEIGGGTSEIQKIIIANDILV